MQLSLFRLLLLTQPLHSSEQHTRANLEFSSNFGYSNCPQNLHNALVLKNWQIFIPFIARPKEQFCCSCQIHIKFSSILFASNFGLIFLWNWLIHFWLNFVKLLQKQTVYFLSHAEYLNGNTKRQCCPPKNINRPRGWYVISIIF